MKNETWRKRYQVEKKRRISDLKERSISDLTILFYCLSVASTCMGVDTVGLRQSGLTPLRRAHLTEKSYKYKIIFEEDIIKTKVIKNG